MAILITDQQFMILGLESAGFTGWERTSNAANVERFRCWYGPRPKCCEKIWFDLQNSVECCIGSDANPLHFLLALRFLKGYPTETELAETFAMSEKTVRKWTSFYVQKIQLLKEEKVRRKIDDDSIVKRTTLLTLVLIFASLNTYYIPGKRLYLAGTISMILFPFSSCQLMELIFQLRSPDHTQQSGLVISWVVNQDLIMRLEGTTASSEAISAKLHSMQQ